MTNNYAKLLQYIKRNRSNSTFDANTLRSKLNVEPKEFTTLVSKAVNERYMHKVGNVPSNVPSHRGRAVGVYARSLRSYRPESTPATSPQTV